MIVWRASPYVDWLSLPAAHWCEKSGRRPAERADGTALVMDLRAKGRSLLHETKHLPNSPIFIISPSM